MGTAHCPSFRFVRQIGKQLLNAQAMHFELFALQIGRDGYLGAHHRASTRKRARHSELIPTVRPPRPVAAKPDGHNWQTQLRGQKDGAGRQLPARTARAVGGYREVHVAATTAHLKQCSRASAIRRTAYTAKTHVVRDARQNFCILVPTQEHRQVAMRSHVERNEYVLVPKHIDARLCAAQVRV